MDKIRGKISKSYPYKEKFSWSKFKKIFSLGSKVEWIKDISSLSNLRKLIIYVIIGGLFFGYGWYRGKLNLPINIPLKYGQQIKIEINTDKDYLHIDKKGNVWIKDRKGDVLKQIKAKDIPGLRKILSPVGLQLHPFILVGGGYGIDDREIELEVGAGVSLIRIWKVNLDAFLTNRGVYGGVSYRLTENSSVGAGIGKGWKKREYRGLIYYKWNF